MNEQKLKRAFGAFPSKKDYRTVKAEALAGAVSIPATATVPLNYPSVTDLCDQGQLGICTMCGVRMGDESENKDGARLSEYWGYLIGKTLIEKNLMEGSSAFTMLKTAYNYGIPTANFTASYPLQIGGTYLQFINDFKARYGGKVPQAILDNAALHKIPGYYEVKVDPLAMAAEIAAGRVLIIRIQCGENFYTSANGTPSWQAKDILPLRAPEYAESGHIMVVNKYTGLNANQLQEGPNSWGKNWGNKGFFSYVFGVQAPDYLTEAWAISEIPQHIVDSIKDLPEAVHFLHTFSVPMRRGDTGPEVRSLQILLSILNFLDIHIDDLGTFGPKTAAAVMAFQRAYTVASPAEIIAANGNVGPKTIAMLNAVGSNIKK